MAEIAHDGPWLRIEDANERSRPEVLLLYDLPKLDLGQPDNIGSIFEARTRRR